MRTVLIVLVLTVAVTANSNFLTSDCDAARAKCALRATCYKSLHAYMVDCADVLAGRITSRCPWACQRALIALTSTEHGLALSSCDCGDSDFCRRSKERIEVCRPAVSHAALRDTRLPCSVAQWVCAADTLCSTALEYYHRLCRPLFHGRKCTPRCNNSLAILERQDKAAKLRDCYCDGREDFPCEDIRRHTRTLCFGLPPERPSPPPSTAPNAPSAFLQLLMGCLLLLLWSAAHRGS